MKPATCNDASSDSDIDVSDILVIDYQLKDDVPGVEIETKDNCLWIPIAHRTRNRLKS